MLRSGAAASWTREYQEIEDFTASPSGSPLAHTTTTTTSPGPQGSAFPLSSSPSSAFPSGRHHQQARDQELPLLPNREPSPGPATPPATTSAFNQERLGLAGRSEESDEHAHAHVPLNSSNASRLSPPSTYSSHSSSTHSAGYHSQPQHQHQHQHQHQAYPPLSHSSQYHQQQQQVTTSTMSSYHEQQGQHNQPQPRPSTSSIGKTSPLNPGSTSAPTTPGLPAHNTPFARPGSRGSLNLMASAASAPGQQAGQGTSGFSRMANEELRALSGPYPNGLTSGLPPTPGSRGSMILYRRADSFTTNGAGLAQGPMAPEEGNRYTLHFPADGGNGGGANGGFLPPPPIGGGGHGGSNRGSMYSVSGDSIASMGMGDSKYPPSLFAPGTPGTPIRTTGSGLRGPFQGLEGRGTSGWGGTDGRGSLFSDGRTSVAFSLNGMGGGGGGLVAYAYDPDEEDLSEDDEDDWLHDPEVAYPKSRKGLFSSSSAPPPLPSKGATGIQHSNSVSGSSAGGHSDAVLKGKASTVGVGGDSARTSAEGPTGTGEKDKRGLRIPHPSKVPPQYRGTASWSWRGVVNITTLIAMLASLLALFMVYPMIRDKMDSGVNARITGNTRINATGQAVEGDSDGGSSSRSASRTTTRELNPGGVTFNRRGVLFDLPPVTATAPSAASFTEGKAPSDWAQVMPFHGKYGSGKDGKEPALRWMRNGKADESVKPWPAPPLVRPPRASPVGGAEVPEATAYYTLEEEDDVVEEGGDDWVILERPPKYKHAEERPKSRAPTATPTRSESGAAEAALWSAAESGEEVLMECGEACKERTNERW